MSAIEKIFKKASTDISLFVNSVISLFKVVFLSSFDLKLPKAENKSCIILGNGPSLKGSLEQNLDRIKKYDLICVNNFAYSEYFEILKPRYYVLLDQLYFNYNDKTIENRESINKAIEKFITINWPIIFLLPLQAEKSYLVTTILNANKNVKIYFFNYVVIEGFTKFRNFIFKKELGMPQCQNVLSASLFQGINLGYKEIYLLGADHSWHEQFSIQKDNKIQIEVSHFYDKPNEKKIVSGEIAIHRNNVAEFFLSLYKAFRSFDVIKEYADYRNIRVYNSSSKSYIDSFEKKDIQEL